MQCGSVRGACSASLGVLRDALVDAPFLPVRRQPRRCSPTADAVGPLGPGADVERSWRRCGGSQSQLSFGGPGAAMAKFGAAGCRCSDAAACASASDATLAFIHVPIASQRMSLAVGADERTPPVSAAHGGRRPRRPAASARCTTPSQPMPLMVTTRISHGNPSIRRHPPAHRSCRMRPTRRASLSAAPSRRTLCPA